MKKEITLGQFISVIALLIISMIGWGVSVEVRLATHTEQLKSIQEIKTDVRDIKKDVGDIKVGLATKVDMKNNQKSK